MDFLTDWLTNWLKELLIGGIMGNLEGLTDYVNAQVGEIAVQVGTTPAAWNAGVFSLIRQLSETVILPIAGLVLTFVATYELIQMLLEKNNMHEFDVANGQTPEWCEGDAPISHGGSWMPSIGQGPGWPDASASFLWQTLEGGVLPKYCLSPAQCSHFLRLAQRAGCPPPAEIEALFLKQGGAYPSPDPFKGSVCGEPPRRGNKQRSKTVSDFQLTLFPLC